jgi:hypothetical protein
MWKWFRASVGLLPCIHPHRSCGLALQTMWSEVNCSGGQKPPLQANAQSLTRLGISHNIWLSSTIKAVLCLP